jgi:hypothetical protein
MKTKKNIQSAFSAVCKWTMSSLLTALLAAMLSFTLAGCPDPNGAKKTNTGGEEPGGTASGINHITDPADLSDAQNGFTPPSTAGKLVSRGAAPAGSATYYIDAANGSDANDGTSPSTAWKSFKNANEKEFQPGDHILLEASSVWNGVSTTKNNYQTLLQSGQAGMLWPKGSGERDRPCVIDFYVNNGGTAVYESAKRPIINGNGTPSATANPYRASGAIYLQGQHFWQIRNIEVTNSYDDFSNAAVRGAHWYKRDVKKALVGIYAVSGVYKKAGGADGPVSAHCIGILVENCYAHDVQSEHNNNGGDGSTGWTHTGNTEFGTRNADNAPGKAGGGIIVEVTDSRVEGNIVRRTALEGIRTSHGDWGTNVIFRGNYIETVAGDGMVMSRVNKTGATTAANNSLVTPGPNLVESNFIKDSCAAPNFGGGNYASNWCYYGNDLTYQYNESWGTLYGNLDGEAWDIDNQSKRVTYQYNYSHHNAGGAVLFMSGGCEDGIFRYNISANDGGSSRYMKTVESAGGLPVDTGAYSYTQFSGGQSLIHYVTGSVKNSAVPLVYNNTFYIGDGISTAVYGTTSSGTGDKYTRFYNNILLKAGEGKVALLNNHNAGTTPGERAILNFDTGFRRNILFAYDTDPKQGDRSKFTHNGDAINSVIIQGGNYWTSPDLKIQRNNNLPLLRKQRDDVFPEAQYNDPSALQAYVSKERLRRRASLFAPVAGSAAISGTRGMTMPAAAGASDTLDGGWYDGGVTEDFFGSTIDSAKAHVGAAAAVYPAL